MYTLIAYKPDNTITCRGHEVDRYQADMQYGNHRTLDELSKAWTPYLEHNISKTEQAPYGFLIYQDGKILYDDIENAGTTRDWTTWEEEQELTEDQINQLDQWYEQAWEEVLEAHKNAQHAAEASRATKQAEAQEKAKEKARKAQEMKEAEEKAQYQRLKAKYETQ